VPCSSVPLEYKRHVKRCRTMNYRVFCEAFLGRRTKRHSNQGVCKKKSFETEILAVLYHPRAANLDDPFPSPEPYWKSPHQPPIPSSFGGSPCNTVHAWTYRDLFNGIFCEPWHGPLYVVESAQSRWRPACNPRSRRFEWDD